MSDGRIECPHAGECPGCPLIRFSYAEGLRTKRARVRTVVGDFPALRSLDVTETRAADPVTSYRTRAKLVVADRRVGLFAESSHDVVDIPGCRVLDPGIGEIVDEIRRELPFDFDVSAIDVRRVDDGYFLTLVVPERTDERLVRDVARRMADDDASLLGVAISRRTEGSARVLGGSPVVLAGASRAARRIRSDGPYHYVTPGAFGQAHAGQEAALVDAVARATARLLGDLRGKTVLELFAGAAAFGLELAARGARVTSVESFGPAAELARAAAAEQRLDLHVEVGDAVRVARTLREAGRRFDAVIVNPPRRGVSPTLRAEIAALASSAILYVSCEPVTLARDLDDFLRLGFSTRTLAPYDMMPLTEEVETLAVLEPCSAPPPDVLHADDALIAVAKAPHEPVSPQGGGRSLLGRVRLLEGAERAVPVHSLDAGASGVCIFARNPEDVTELARELDDGHREYTALVRGIARKKGSVTGSRGPGGREAPARTRYARAGVLSGHSLVYVVPERDRKHQIQRHLASIGHPVIGDRRFGDERTNVHFEARHFLDRPFLHLGFVRLERQGAPLELSSPLPPDLEHCLDGLEKRVTA